MYSLKKQHLFQELPICQTKDKNWENRKMSIHQMIAKKFVQKQLVVFTGLGLGGGKEEIFANWHLVSEKIILDVRKTGQLQVR